MTIKKWLQRRVKKDFLPKGVGFIKMTVFTMTIILRSTLRLNSLLWTNISRIMARNIWLLYKYSIEVKSRLGRLGIILLSIAMWDTSIGSCLCRRSVNLRWFLSILLGELRVLSKTTLNLCFRIVSFLYSTILWLTVRLAEFLFICYRMRGLYFCGFWTVSWTRLWR